MYEVTFVSEKYVSKYTVYHMKSMELKKEFHLIFLILYINMIILQFPRKYKPKRINDIIKKDLGIGSLFSGVKINVNKKIFSQLENLYIKL
jgi:hypothetical protein